MRKAYPSDLTDEQWEIIRPLIPVNQVGRPREVETREVLNTIFYLNRSGCQWDMLPHDLLAKSTAYDYFAQWRDDGTWQKILDALRRRVRTEAGRQPSPAPVALTARRSRGPRSGAREVMTAVRRSPGGSDISSWIPWGCSWWLRSQRHRRMTGRLRRKSWGR